MKNIIEISQDGEQLISSIDVTGNSLYINNTLIAQSQYIGSGTYTRTVEGHSIKITKASNANANLQLVRLSEYNYALKEARKPGDGEYSAGDSINISTEKEISVYISEATKQAYRDLGCDI